MTNMWTITRMTTHTRTHLRREVCDLGDVLQGLPVPPRLPLLCLQHLAVSHVDRVPLQHPLEQRQPLVEALREQHLF